MAILPGIKIDMSAGKLPRQIDRRTPRQQAAPQRRNLQSGKFYFSQFRDIVENGEIHTEAGREHHRCIPTIQLKSGPV